MAVSSPSTMDTRIQDSETVEPRPQSLDIDYAAEEKLLMKVDSRVMSVVLPASVFVFLDRTNIGNARLYGLEEELDLSNMQFSIALSVLFVTYAFAEISSDLIINRVGLSRWIPLMAFMWGATSTCTGLARNFENLLALRLLLGLFEGGLFAGIVQYTSSFYSNRMAMRLPLFVYSSCVAGIVGSLLACAVDHMDGALGYRGWRWTMLLGGIPMCLLAIAAVFVVADDPETARYLSAAEKALLRSRRHDTKRGGGDGDGAWPLAAVNLCCATVVYGYATSLPSILHGLDPARSVPMVHAVSLSCYLGGMLGVAVPALCALVSKRGEPHPSAAPGGGVGGGAAAAAAAALVACAGYVVLLATDGGVAGYFGCVLVPPGVHAAAAANLRILRDPGGFSKADAVGVAAGGVVMSFIYPGSDGPRYYLGHSVSLGLALVAVVIVAFLSWHSSRVGERRAAGKEDGGAAAVHVEELGGWKPRLAYTA